MAVGPLIRDLRSARGWSQGRLAAELRKVSGRGTVTRETVSRWETGKIECPDPYWLRYLATVLQVPLQVLENEKLDRRRFLTDAAATAIAPIVASDLIHSGFAAALNNKGPDDDAWRETLTRYGQDYMSLGAVEIQKRLAADLLVIQQQLDTPAMWEVSSKLMTLYGKTFPGSDGSKAVQWYRTAVA